MTKPADLYDSVFTELSVTKWPPFQSFEVSQTVYPGVSIRHVRTKKYFFGRLYSDKCAVENPETGAMTPVSKDWTP